MVLPHLTVLQKLRRARKYCMQATSIRNERRETKEQTRRRFATSVGSAAVCVASRSLSPPIALSTILRGIGALFCRWRRVLFVLGLVSTWSRGIPNDIALSEGLFWSHAVHISQRAIKWNRVLLKAIQPKRNAFSVVIVLQRRRTRGAPCITVYFTSRSDLFLGYCVKDEFLKSSKRFLYIELWCEKYPYEIMSGCILTTRLGHNFFRHLSRRMRGKIVVSYPLPTHPNNRASYPLEDSWLGNVTKEILFRDHCLHGSGGCRCLLLRADYQLPELNPGGIGRHTGRRSRSSSFQQKTPCFEAITEILIEISTLAYIADRRLKGEYATRCVDAVEGVWLGMRLSL